MNYNCVCGVQRSWHMTRADALARAKELVRQWREVGQSRTARTYYYGEPIDEVTGEVHP